VSFERSIDVRVAVGGCDPVAHPFLAQEPQQLDHARQWLRLGHIPAEKLTVAFVQRFQLSLLMRRPQPGPDGGSVGAHRFTGGQSVRLGQA